MNLIFELFLILRRTGFQTVIKKTFMVLQNFGTFLHLFVMLQDLECLQIINIVYNNNYSLQPEYTTDLSRLEWKDHKLSTFCIFPVLLK